MALFKRRSRGMPPAGMVLVVGFQTSAKIRLSIVTLLLVCAVRVHRSAILVTQGTRSLPEGSPPGGPVESVSLDM